MPHTKELIEYLSSEITTYGDQLMTFRSRMAFTVLIGPFVLLGSIVIANGEAKTVNDLGVVEWASLALACGCYLALGRIGMILDGQVTKQCKEWRTQILSVHNGKDLNEDALNFEHKIGWWYIVIMVLVLCAFLSSGYFVMSLIYVESAATIAITPPCKSSG